MTLATLARGGSISFFIYISIISIISISALNLGRGGHGEGCKFLALLSIKTLNSLWNISPLKHLLGDQQIIPGIFYLAVKMPQSS